MGLLDWMKSDNSRNTAAERGQIYLTHAERWALRRMTQHLDDGLFGYRQGGAWEKTFNAMAERLTLRFRDPLGDRAVALTPEEAKALGEFQKICERDVEDIYPGSTQMISDTRSLREALERSGVPAALPEMNVAPLREVQRDPEFDPTTHGHENWKAVFDEVRADEALAKVRSETGREPEDLGQEVNKNADVSPIWRPEPYKVRSSGYLVQPCVGWSEKGYHPGLTVKPPNAEAKTYWGAASCHKGPARVEAGNAFSSWLDSHEAQFNRAKVSSPKSGRSWER